MGGSRPIEGRYGMANWEAYDDQVYVDMEKWVDDYAKGPEGLYMPWLLGVSGFGDAVRQAARRIEELCAVSKAVTGYDMGYYDNEDDARDMASTHIDCLMECATNHTIEKTDADALYSILDEGWVWCDVFLRQEAVSHNSLLLANRICEKMTDRFDLGNSAASFSRYSMACETVMTAWVGEADYTVEYTLGDEVAKDSRHYKTRSELINTVLTVGCNTFICID